MPRRPMGAAGVRGCSYLVYRQPSSRRTIGAGVDTGAFSPMSTTTAAMTRDIETSQGLARAHLRVSGKTRGALVLGHGAGGGVAAPDLQAAAAAALEHDLTVALVEQPYRVAARRSPAPAPRLDAAWIDVLGQLGAHDLANLPVVVGGRSAGA